METDWTTRLHIRLGDKIFIYDEFNRFRIFNSCLNNDGYEYSHFIQAKRPNKFISIRKRFGYTPSKLQRVIFELSDNFLFETSIENM